MKKFLIYVIKLYQRIPGSFHNHCRCYPSCSNYALIAIYEHGVIKGSFLALKRIIKCNPWGISGYDPVPMVRRNK